MNHKSADSDRPKRGRPDYHDPTAGVGGAAPAYSALTLRIVLSSLGLIFGLIVLLVALLAVHETPLIIGGALLSVLALINLLVVVRRKARGEPG